MNEKTGQQPHHIIFSLSLQRLDFHSGFP